MDHVIDLLRAARDTRTRARARSSRRCSTCAACGRSSSTTSRNPENELPEQLRAGIVSIGIWMNKEIDRVRAGQTNDLTPMIEINEIIRDGLK